MTNNFILTLDTTPPADVVAVLAEGAVATATVDVNLNTTTSDPDTTGYQMKVWGDVEGAPDEASAVWVNYTVDRPIVLTADEGLKTVWVRLRDDVGNEAAPVSDTITLDLTAPVITITIDPTRIKVSKVPGWNLTTFSFAADQDLQAWIVCVVADSNATHTDGTVIPMLAESVATSGGALAANTNEQVTISGTDLEAASPGDGPKVIKVFGQDVNGNWSA